MSGARNYLFVHGQSVAYQLNDDCVLGRFNDSLDRPSDETVISYSEAKNLFAKPLTKDSFLRKCNALYARVKNRPENKVAELALSEQKEISDLIYAAQSALTSSR